MAVAVERERVDAWLSREHAGSRECFERRESEIPSDERLATQENDLPE